MLLIWFQCKIDLVVYSTFTVYNLNEGMFWYLSRKYNITPTTYNNNFYYNITDNNDIAAGNNASNRVRLEK